jgi:hypothetical protein
LRVKARLHIEDYENRDKNRLLALLFAFTITGSDELVEAIYRGKDRFAVTFFSESEKQEFLHYCHREAALIPTVKVEEKEHS